MFKFLRERKKDNKGFTLVELVIVVAILAILVGLLAPQYTKYVEKSRKSADAANLENLVTAFKTAASDGNDQVPAATDYKFTIGADETTLTGAHADAVKGLITSFAGNNWEKITLKSSKWEKADGSDTVEEIGASITVANDGSVTVTYDPTNFKDQANQ